MSLSESEKALQTVRISDEGLPREWLPLKIAREMRQRGLRDGRIYRDYLAADNPDSEVVVLAERWGLEAGHIRNIIEKQDRNGVVPAMAAEIEVLRQTKRRQILEDGEEYRTEIQAQITQFEALREDGTDWLDVEQSDETGGKNGDVTKTKRQTINTVIKSLKNELAKSHEIEAAAIERYIPKQVQTLNVNINKKASDEFMEQFDRIGRFNEVKPIVTDITNKPIEGEESE
jgi:hypothetical protein